MSEEKVVPRCIVFGVTSSKSLKLLGIIPGEMAKSGWEVHVVSASGAESDRWRPQGVWCHVIEMERSPSPIRDLQALKAWKNLLREIKPDVVSIGTPKAALLGLLAARVHRIPRRVYMLRGLRLEGTRGFWQVVLTLLERLTAHCSTEILSVSESLKDRYQQRKLDVGRQITVLGKGSSHGVNIQHFAPERRETALSRELLPHSLSHPERPIVGFVGRFCREKGALTLLACKREFERLSIDHEFIIAGEIEDSAHILAEMEMCGRPVVHLPDLQDLRGLYAVLNLLLLPSWREGLPNVVLEAAAAGVPTITTDATGAVDAVVDGHTGTVTALGDDCAFIRAAVELMQNRERATVIGKNARRWVAQNFEETKVARLHVNFYNLPTTGVSPSVVSPHRG